METVTYETPVIYGDHHVIEVRKILSELPGVKDIYVSSAFHTIQVSYDKSLTSDDQISKALDSAGYLGGWTIPVEMDGKTPGGEGNKPFFRHTQVNETVKKVVGFAQNVNMGDRPQWPCPGMGLSKSTEEN